MNLFNKRREATSHQTSEALHNRGYKKQTHPKRHIFCLMMKTARFYTLSAIFVAFLLISYVSSKEDETEAAEKEEEVAVDEEKLSYAKGSLCQYCDYCKVKSYIIAQSTETYLLCS